jgi:hypothetical protein
MVEENMLILGLDVSSKTIGISLFKDVGEKGELMHLQHVSPNIKPKPKNKVEELFLKAELFEKEYLNKLALDYKGKISKVIIEEPLLRSNNVYTVEILIRFNTLVSNSVYKLLGIVPEYISSYDARAFGFPELMQIRKYNKKNELYTDKERSKMKPTLFGEYKWDVDKKEVVYNLVADLEPLINWSYDKNNKLKKENYDQSDAYCVVLGQMKKIGKWK